MFEIVRESFQKIRKRASFFASHCGGLISAYDPLTVIFGMEYLTNGRVSTLLNRIPWLGGRAAGYFTIGYYLVDLNKKMTENYHKHPDSMTKSAKEIKKRELCRTSRTILGMLRDSKEDVRQYIQTQSTLNKKQVGKLLDSVVDNTDEFTLLQFFKLYHEVHAIKHPQHQDRWKSFKMGGVHFFPHLIIGMLFKSFAGINLYDETISAEQGICIAFLLMGFYSWYQTYHFNMQSKKPTSYDLLTAFAQDTGMFSAIDEAKETAIAVRPVETTPLLPMQPEDEKSIDELVYELAEIDAFAPCCLTGHM